MWLLGSPNRLPQHSQFCGIPPPAHSQSGDQCLQERFRQGLPHTLASVSPTATWPCWTSPSSWCCCGPNLTNLDPSLKMVPANTAALQPLVDSSQWSPLHVMGSSGRHSECLRCPEGILLTVFPWLRLDPLTLRIFINPDPLEEEVV